MAEAVIAEKVYGKTGEELSFEKRDSLWNEKVYDFISKL